MGDAQQPDVGNEPNGEDVHPDVLENQTPAFITAIFSDALGFLQLYGWFIIVGVLILLYIWNKFKPTYQKLQQKAEDARSKKYDPDVAQQRIETMEAARRRLQEEHDAKAVVFAEQQKIKEEEKRQQKIKEYEDRLAGISGKSSLKPKEDEIPSTINKPKSKPRLRQNDYSPLMGGGGSGYRPPPRGGGG